MNNYNYIVNPKTGRKVQTNGKIGLQILQNYLTQLGGAKLVMHDSSGGMFTAPGRLVVLGDIHGDYDAFISSLSIAGLIESESCFCERGVHEDSCIIGIAENQRLTSDLPDERKSQYSFENRRWKWIGGNSYLVLVGDMVDRWRESPNSANTHGIGEFVFEEEVIQRVLNNLRLQATEKGGKVIKVIGNHEKLNFDNIFKYVTPFALSNDGGHIGRREKWAPGGLMRNLLKGVVDDAQNDVPAVDLHSVVNIGNWMFMHGGLMSNTLSEYIKQTNPGNKTSNNFVSEVDVLFQQYLNDNNNTPLLNSVFGVEKTGLLWERSQGEEMTHPQMTIICRDFSKLRVLLGNSDLKLGVAHCNQTFNLPVSGSGSVAYVTPNKIKDTPLTYQFNKDTEGKIVPYECSDVGKNIWNSGSCFPGITHICAGEPKFGAEARWKTKGAYYVCKTFSQNEDNTFDVTFVDDNSTRQSVPVNEINIYENSGTNLNGNIWRLDVGMSRGFDMSGSIWCNIMKSLSEYTQANNNYTSYDDNKQPLSKNYLRGFLLSRRPQVMITNNSADNIEVVKASVSLPRNALCPLGGCEMCAMTGHLKIDEFINCEDDDISKYAQGIDD